MVPTCRQASDSASLAYTSCDPTPPTQPSVATEHACGPRHYRLPRRHRRRGEAGHTDELRMTSETPQDDLRGRVRGLLITVADQLPVATAGIVDELIDADEQGIAVEMLSEMLVESNAPISPDI